MTQQMSDLIRLAEALRDRDLANLAAEERALADLREAEQTARSDLDAAQSPDLDQTQWPGATLRWTEHLQLKRALVLAQMETVNQTADAARDRARRSFGRAAVLKAIGDAPRRDQTS